MDFDTAHAPASPPAMVRQAPKVGGFMSVPLDAPAAKTALAPALRLVKTLGELEQ